VARPTATVRAVRKPAILLLLWGGVILHQLARTLASRIAACAGAESWHASSALQTSSASYRN
jgi:hypothetical protein